MNTFIVRFEFTDGFTYSCYKEIPIKTNLTLEGLYCKISDELEECGIFEIDGHNIDNREFEVLTLRDWLKGYSVTLE